MLFRLLTATVAYSEPRTTACGAGLQLLGGRGSLQQTGKELTTSHPTSSRGSLDCLLTGDVKDKPRFSLEKIQQSMVVTLCGHKAPKMLQRSARRFRP